MNESLDYEYFSDFIKQTSFDLRYLDQQAQSILIAQLSKLISNNEYNEMLEFTYISEQLKVLLKSINEASNLNTVSPTTNREYIESVNLARSLFKDFRNLLKTGAVNKDKLISLDRIDSKLPKEDIELLQELSEILKAEE